MLKRKMETVLMEWKDNPQRNPLVIKGCRQCGKTSTVLAFAKANYEKVVYINFLENSEYGQLFSGSLSVDYLAMLISSKFNTELVAGKTILIFDEIQDCPEARTALKFFKLDGRFDVIATGSLLGVSGYGKSPKSIPVGFETILEMRPMDFEEFLWANGIKSDYIEFLHQCMKEEKIIPDAIHQQMRQLLLQYVVVGGMPAVVQSFVLRHDMAEVLRMQRDIVSGYRDDVVKYAEMRNKTLIRQCFDTIPVQLAKENKKFQYSVVRKNGTADQFRGILQWLEDAGIAKKCYNLHTPELPLVAQADNNIFKLYMADTGLFVSMLDDGTQSAILMGQLSGYKGAIYENLMADFLIKMGRKLFYFRKDSGLEIDFVIQRGQEATLVEVKATQGNAKSLRSVMENPERYRVNSAIKFGDYNIGRNGNILTLPLYLGFCLNR